MSTVDLTRQLEKLVTVEGCARDAGAGAIVLQANSEPIYVAGLETWGDKEGITVTVSGILRRRAVIAISTLDEEGAISHGLDSAVFVIDDPTWKFES
jgi:hypothetical protein